MSVKYYSNSKYYYHYFNTVGSFEQTPMNSNMLVRQTINTHDMCFLQPGLYQ